MEQLNSVNLTGRVNTCGPVLQVAGRTARRMTLDTVTVFQSSSNDRIERATHHQVFLVEGGRVGADDIFRLAPGVRVSVRGRMRAVRTSAGGSDMEVCADTLRIEAQDADGYVNAVELVGRVGAVNGTGLPKAVSFSLCTESIRKDFSEGVVTETVWHSVTATERAGITEADLAGAAKGAAVHVTGRLDAQTYLGADGTEKRSVTVTATQLRTIKD